MRWIELARSGRSSEEITASVSEAGWVAVPEGSVHRTALVNRLRGSLLIHGSRDCRARRLRQDDAARAVGGARRAAVRVGVARRQRLWPGLVGARLGASCRPGTRRSRRDGGQGAAVAALAADVPAGSSARARGKVFASGLARAPTRCGETLRGRDRRPCLLARATSRCCPQPPSRALRGRPGHAHRAHRRLAHRRLPRSARRERRTPRRRGRPLRGRLLRLRAPLGHRCRRPSLPHPDLRARHVVRISLRRRARGRGLGAQASRARARGASSRPARPQPFQLSLPPRAPRLAPRSARADRAEARSRLHRRASAWCEAAGDAEGAIRHAHAAGERDRLAGLVASHALAAWAEGRGDAVETWIGWFEERGLNRYPAIALLGARVHMLRGRTAEAERWLAEAERSSVKATLPDGSRSLESWLAVLHALSCREGLERMQADAETALRKLAPGSFWRPTALLVSGMARVLAGEEEAGEIIVTEAAEAAEAFPDVSAVPTLARRPRGGRAAGARPRRRGSVRGAGRPLGGAGRRARARARRRSAIAYAVSARRRLRLRTPGRGACRSRARRGAPRAAFSGCSLVRRSHQSRARERASRASRRSGARAWHAHAGEILRRRPGLGRLAARHEAVAAEIDTVAQAQEGRAGALTPAELRLLPLLATYRSFREIGEQLQISRNTVKTQAISVYRKLGVSSRSDAIERAAGLGLLDG